MNQFKDPKTEELLRHIQDEMKKSLQNVQSPELVFEIFDMDMQDIETQDIETKKIWNNILDETSVLLAIMSYLSPKDLFNFIHLELENDQNFSSDLFSAIYSVDIEQLQERYIDFEIPAHSAIFYIVFFFQNDVTITYKEYTKISSHLR
ncbi:5977_t:CDS:2 [Cetraspora pellucida]|uniref:5977_t:CDS:1 n=1 Tax=Cetraspora pellucida TaxID=1433469 RepID=A0A9N8YUR2_9GLOM|nr:5977_t:CDS:2 [Cetraspora pellucida]